MLEMTWYKGMRMFRSSDGDSETHSESKSKVDDVTEPVPRRLSCRLQTAEHHHAQIADVLPLRRRQPETSTGISNLLNVSKRPSLSV